MPTLTDLVRRHTALDEADIDRLHALVSDWQLLADLSFADLILWVPESSGDAGAGSGAAPGDRGGADERAGGGRAGGERDRDSGEEAGPGGGAGATRATDPAAPAGGVGADGDVRVPLHPKRWVAVAQMRPTTGPTAYPTDLVGTVAESGGRLSRRGLIDIAWREGRICREGDPEWGNGIPVREESIPVRRGRKMLGVIQRTTNLNSARTPSRLELTYLQSAADLAQMISDGRFPEADEEPNLVRSPRVGDGLLRLDRSGVVTYASPNAQSAYRRLGLATDLVGTHLGETTAALCASTAAVDDSLALVTGGRAAREIEVEGNGSIVQLRAIPLVVGGVRIAALVLLRDVTELRRRERELMSKDATIREIHHRVKNNLQTVAALLRLQARRLQVAEARDALDEAVRRVGSIAIVHETLSHTPEEMVDFDDVADRVIAMAGEVSSPDSRVTPRRTGSFGVLPAGMATPLAMVLTELLQNALQHGLAGRPGLLEVRVRRDRGRLVVTVVDDGRGLPGDFDIDTSTSLGLQIVRTLIVGELGGKLDITPRATGGAEVTLDIPFAAP